MCLVQGRIEGLMTRIGFRSRLVLLGGCVSTGLVSQDGRCSLAVGWDPDSGDRGFGSGHFQGLEFVRIAIGGWPRGSLPPQLSIGRLPPGHILVHGSSAHMV